MATFAASGAMALEPRDAPASAVRSRTFRFHYGATVTGLPPGSPVHVWVPVPPSNEHQQVVSLPSHLRAAGRIATEPIYGNKILSFQSRAPADGRLVFSTSYRVHRREIRGLDPDGRPGGLSPRQRTLFLSANQKVPLSGKPLQLLEGITLPQRPLDVARVLYRRVDQLIRYDKSQPGYGAGDVLWVCDSRTGNCTDFHSLFIAWARSQGVPARFEIGYSLPLRRGRGTIGGYHCWAFFYDDDKGWVPVDISEANKHPEMKDYYFGNLTEDRVAFTTGRDIELVPKQKGPPLNYFIYPYVQVAGAAWPQERIVMTVRFEDE